MEIEPQSKRTWPGATGQVLITENTTGVYDLSIYSADNASKIEVIKKISRSVSAPAELVVTHGR